MATDCKRKNRAQTSNSHVSQLRSVQRNPTQQPSASISNALALSCRGLKGPGRSQKFRAWEASLCPKWRTRSRSLGVHFQCTGPELPWIETSPQHKPEAQCIGRISLSKNSMEDSLAQPLRPSP